VTDRHPLLRERAEGRVAVGNAELFFDLVYVFAITQISHFLLKHHDAAGMLEALILFLAVWWAWIYMVWATNWLDPESGPVRILIFATMLVGLVMSASIPQAFGERGLWFALSYIGVQVIRTAIVASLVRPLSRGLSLNLWRATIWFAATIPLWIYGAFQPAETRIWLWGAAILLNSAGPACSFIVPGLGRSRTTDYPVSGSHMAERCALLIIVALGEYLLVSGGAFSELKWNALSLAAFFSAFAGSVLLWWIYFDFGMERGARTISHHADSGRMARDAYTYMHIPIVAGIIVAAVGDEMALAQPLARSEPLFIGTAVGGPALFVVGTMTFKRMTSGRPWFPLSHLFGLGMLGLVAVWGLLAEPTRLVLGGGIGVALLTVAVWEWGSYHGGWAERGMPQPEFFRRRAEAKLAKVEGSPFGDDRA
jgi:low temperature requirement protein LtrA